MTVADAPPRSVSSELAGRVHPFRRLARVAAGLIALSAVVGTVDMIVRGSAYIATGVLLAAPDWLPLQYVYPRVNEWGRGPLAELERVLVTVRSVWFGIMLLAGLVFLLWLIRAAENLRDFGIPSSRVRTGLAVVSLLALIPALFAAHAVLTDQQQQFAIPAIVVAGLTAPLIVVRRLWIASIPRTSDTHFAQDRAATPWTGITVWWVAFVAYWMSSRLALTMFEESAAGAYTPLETALRAMATGSLEFIAGVAWATAAVFVVRIIFRVTAMQIAVARASAALAAPDLEHVVGARVAAAADSHAVDPDPAAPVVPPQRRRSVQWQCQSCEYLNATAMRFCQNCAQERR